MALNDAQIWTIIGILAAAFVGTITVTTQLMMRAFTAQLTGLGRQVESSHAMLDLKIDHLREHLTDRLQRVETRLDGVETRLDKVEHRFDSLDRDMQAIARRVFPTEPD
ncbi:hypothetical protein [Agromyces larvae]|uniref:DUF2746 domain-containing protein n=1 Tax=Agromyces larvae TaxID=2929802 RepID=A0ABY4C297_9MICO|nr:hypothetical protein [Agromyces larvae]UOE45562.1 hypothetical protein MTO99_07345 [Agromyces larvae]